MLLLHEIRKLAAQPALIAYVALALIVNLMYAAGIDNNYDIDYEAAAGNTSNPFEDYRGDVLPDLARDLGESRVFDSMLAAKIHTWKYTLLKPVIDEKALRDDGASDYFTGASNRINAEAIENPGKLLASEGCVLFLLLVLYSLTMEGVFGTDLLILSSRKGRRVMPVKILAAVLTGCAVLALLTAATYGAVFAKLDFSAVWDDNISSRFHTVYTFPFGHLPFFTWSVMTVKDYLWGHIGINFLLSLVSALFAVPFALLIRRSYVSFLGAAGLIFLSIIPLFKTRSLLYFIVFSLPVTQVYKNDLWFSDGGGLNLLPRFEVLYPLIWMAVFGAAAFMAYRLYLRKDVV